MTKEFTEVGQWVAKGGPVAEIIEIQEVDLEVAVLETYAPNLRVGLEATVELDTYPDQIFAGRVALVVPSADPQSRSFPVKIRIENQRQALPPSGDGGSTPQMQLMPGMFARANLPVGGSQELTLVHKDALVLERTQKSVFVVDTDAEREDPRAWEPYAMFRFAWASPTAISSKSTATSSPARSWSPKATNASTKGATFASSILGTPALTIRQTVRKARRKQGKPWRSSKPS